MKKNGFIYELDKYIWEDTCRQLQKWRNEGRNPLPVSVNISRYDIFKEDLPEVLNGLILKYELPVDLLRLEITESAFSKSADQIIRVVHQLIDLGFTIEIDDFGSSYSSLNTLKDVPAQILKLDMRFLEDTSNSKRGGNILESIVRMAKWLGMSVIAEGVETTLQADYLKTIGCQYVQGYLYAKPMPAADYEVSAIKTIKEKSLITLETVENLDNNNFWDPKSMDTIIFNSYIGAACIFEYRNKHIEFLRVNNKYLNALNSETMTVDDILKLDWIALLDKNQAPHFHSSLKSAINTGNEFTDEFMFRDLPGCPKETYLRSTMRVIATADDCHLIYCISENITAQRRAEQKEREAERRSIVAAQRLTSIMDNLPFGTALYELNGQTMTPLHLNKRYWELVGRKSKNGKFESILDSIHPDDIPAHRKELTEAIRHGRDYSLDTRILYGTEKYRQFHIDARLVRQEEGKYLVYAAYSPISDETISYREMVPVALSAIMESTTDLTFAKDRDFRYICASQEFAHMIGYESSRRLIGKTDYDLFDRELADKYRHDDEALMSSEESLVDVTEFIPSPNELPRYSSTSKYLLRDSKDEIIGLYGIGRDITESRDAFEKLKLLTGCIPGGLATYELAADKIRLLYFNDGYYKPSGYLREEFSAHVADDPYFTVLTEDRPIIDKAIHEILEGQTDFLIESCRCSAKDGTFCRYRLAGSVSERLANSCIIYVVKYAVSNTE